MVNIGSGNGLVPSGSKPLPEPMLTQICRHMVSLGHNELTSFVILRQSWFTEIKCRFWLRVKIIVVACWCHDHYLSLSFGIFSVCLIGNDCKHYFQSHPILQLYGEMGWVIKFNSLSRDSGHWGPSSPYKQCNHSLYIGIIIFPHIYNPQSTDHNLL